MFLNGSNIFIILNRIYSKTLSYKKYCNVCFQKHKTFSATPVSSRIYFKIITGNPYISLTIRSQTLLNVNFVFEFPHSPIWPD